MLPWTPSLGGDPCHPWPHVPISGARGLTPALLCCPETRACSLSAVLAQDQLPWQLRWDPRYHHPCLVLIVTADTCSWQNSTNTR